MQRSHQFLKNSKGALKVEKAAITKRLCDIVVWINVLNGYYTDPPDFVNGITTLVCGNTSKTFVPVDDRGYYYHEGGDFDTADIECPHTKASIDQRGLVINLSFFVWQLFIYLF